MIAHQWDEYRELVKYYTDKDATKNKDAPVVADAKTPEFRALAKLGVTMPCCRIHFITTLEMLDKID